MYQTEVPSTAIPIPEGIKGLIFDLDGTIIDSMPLHFKAYNYCLEPYGIKYDEETFFSRGGIPTKDTLLMIAKDNGIEDFDLEEVIKRKREYVDTKIDQMKLIEPTMEVIKAYQSILPMAVGTGSNRKTVTAMFEMFDLNKYFEHSVTATDVQNFKPHPETFLKAAELIDIDPKDCLVFEDGKPGMEAAISAGMKVIDITQYV
ncbi:HAD family hydrolase [Reichenbachiella versicolor]|uniref:HAD family hydrolase n=1 Tax=Reichenbachiella versicolor TaxID=1821036 RepID=UPI000D6DF188|nr:HAD family phosphatase [Reichenbachiella versicolor]